MRIRLNIATKPLQTHRRFVAGAVAAGAAGLLLLVALSSSVIAAWRENRGERAEIERYQAQLVHIRAGREELAAYFNSPQTRTVMNRATFLNSLIDQRSFPWTKMFTDLENVLPAGVRVVSIAPKMQNGRVEVGLTIGASSDKSKVEFLEALQASSAFFMIEVKSEARATQPGSPDEIDVDLNALYRETGGER